MQSRALELAERSSTSQSLQSGASRSEALSRAFRAELRALEHLKRSFVLRSIQRGAPRSRASTAELQSSTSAKISTTISRYGTIQNTDHERTACAKCNRENVTVLRFEE